MEIQVVDSSPTNVKLSITKSDVGMLYIVQHELLSSNNVNFAGVIIKHPLTNECWVQVDAKKPITQILSALDSSSKVIDDMQGKIKSLK